MDTMNAFILGEAHKNCEAMVFDWDKAARMIKESGFKDASAGLQGDWEWTGGSIFVDGKPDLKSYTYLSSTWATPEIEIDGETFDCYLMQSETEWGHHTKWPESALKIIQNNE